MLDVRCSPSPWAGLPSSFGIQISEFCLLNSFLSPPPAFVPPPPLVWMQKRKAIYDKRTNGTRIRKRQPARARHPAATAVATRGVVVRSNAPSRGPRIRLADRPITAPRANLVTGHAPRSEGVTNRRYASRGSPKPVQMKSRIRLISPSPAMVCSFSNSCQARLIPAFLR